jgi:uncharacterized membrane protein YfcA
VRRIDSKDSPVLSGWEDVGVLAAGMVAGLVNTVVGSGSLLTFPTLVGFGYTPLIANVTNTVGLVPGGASGAFGYRRELAGQGALVRRLAITAVAGGATGATLLLALPGTAFQKVVPFLVLIACMLVVLQPRLAAGVAARRAARATEGRDGGLALDVAMFGTAVYGGYFGAAQGVILIALMGILLGDELQRLNAVKNVVVGVVNATAAIIFIVFSHIAWLPAILLAVGATVGGQLGASVGRRIPPKVLRTLILVVGIVVAIKQFADW